MHLSSYLANFIWNLSGTLEEVEETPYPSTKWGNLDMESLALGTFVSPVLMRHTVPQPPNVDLGKIWLHSSKPEKNPATSALHCVLLRGSICSFLDTFQLATNEDSKGFVSKNGYLQPKINLRSIISLPFPRNKTTQKCLDKQLLDGENSGKRGGIGMMYLVDVPKMPPIYRISSIWNWLDRFLWQAKWRTPQKVHLVES